MPTSLFLSSKMFNFKNFSSLVKSRQAPLVTSFPFFFFSSHLNNSFITKYREDYDFSMVIKYNSFIIKEFNLLNLCLQLCWIHTHTHIYYTCTHTYPLMMFKIPIFPGHYVILGLWKL